MALTLLKGEDFVLDTKVLLPRMTRSGRQLCAETKYWNNLKHSVLAGQEIDWSELTHSFWLKKMIGPQKLAHGSRIDHMRLKGLFSFFQMGYVLTQDDKVALFHRHSAAHKISTKHSPVISCSASNLTDHDCAIDKICKQIGKQTKVTRVTPFAIGYTELTAAEDNVPAPAYFWLLHKVDMDKPLPNTCQPLQDCDSFVGMKQPINLLSGKSFANKQPVVIDREFDRLVLDLLDSHGMKKTAVNSAIRLLSEQEIKNLHSTPFRTGTEHLARRLTLLGLLVSGFSMTATAAQTVNVFQSGEWAYQHMDDLMALLNGLKETIDTFFVGV